MQWVKRSIDKDIMQEILDRFTDLTDIRVAYFDESGEKITGRDKGTCRFCSMIRKNPILYDACIQSDGIAFKKACVQESLYLYKCHMGLWEAVVPIVIRGCHAGVLMLGQVKSTEGIAQQWGFVQKRLELSGFDIAEQETVRSAFSEIQALTREKIEAAARMLDIITRYIIDTEIIHLYDMEAIEKAKKYIRERYTKKLSTRDIANFVGLSPSYLSFLFKRETGFTVTSHIEKLRIDHASRLLLMTPLSVKEITAQIGFEDQNYFSRIFKKRTGMSPLNYRRKNKK